MVNGIGCVGFVCGEERNCICTDKKDVSKNVYAVDHELGEGAGGEENFFLSVSPGMGNRPPRKKKIANPWGVCPGGMVTSKIELCIDH